jgi:hypothetical protein
MSRRSTAVLATLALLLSAPAHAEMPGDYGDAPEGTLAYPDLGVTGAFPTCRSTGPAGYVYHMGMDAAYLGTEAAFDAEADCPEAAVDGDECFEDGDAGLIEPIPWTIQEDVAAACSGLAPTPLSTTCSEVTWGEQIDIMVRSLLPQAYLNVLADWNRDGRWGGSVSCTGDGEVPEHVLVNFPIPEGYSGRLSDLMEGPERTFLSGPSGGRVWFRFTISDTPVPEDWNGEGEFAAGETEDYLLSLEPPTAVTPLTWGRVKTIYR